MKIVLPLLAALALGACGDRPQPADTVPAGARDPLAVTAAPELETQIAVGAAARSEVREMLRVPGRVEADENRMARVGSPVTGRITDLRATVGMDVQRGAVLATINSTELSAAQLAYLKALSQRQLAARSAARARQLFEADVIGAAELQRRQSELAMAEAEESAAADQLKVLGMSAQAVARLSETRAINSLSQVVASISGTIIERKVTEGQVVQPADSVFLVADLSSVWVVADIPEQSAGSVHVGEEVTVEFAALPGRVVNGKLTFVSPVVNPETRTVRARLDLPNPQREFKPDMLASVLVRGKPQPRLIVPAEAVVREDNRDHVFVRLGEGRYRLQAVELGAEHDGKRIVLGGLREGEAVVTSGAFHLNNERKRQAMGSGR
jgi:cobalt-zinc-cadmium efflux system membrane fusion protein